MTKWLNTGNEHDTFHILRRLLLGGKQPTKKSWVGVGREASPPWLHATQLLPPGFVSSSVLHFSYTVPHLTDANRGTTCSSNGGFAWCSYVYSCTAVKKAQIDARQGKSWKFSRIMQQRHVRDLALVLWLPHFWVKIGLRGEIIPGKNINHLLWGEKNEDEKFSAFSGTFVDCVTRSLEIIEAETHLVRRHKNAEREKKSRRYAKCKGELGQHKDFSLQRP